MAFLKAMAQIAGLVVLAALMLPLFLVGLIAGIAWIALYAGFVSWEIALDWVTDGSSTWQIKLAQKVKP